MKSLAFFSLLILLVPQGGSAAADTLDVQVVDGRISIHAASAPLVRLLNLLDRVAGTESTVPSELANRNVNVQFRELELDRAIRKIFEGLGIDYAILGENRIIVTAASQTLDGRAVIPPVPASGLSSSAPTPGQNVPQNPFQLANPGNNPNTGAGATQPTVIQTPFGPVVSTPADPPGTPLSGPGQGFFPFGSRGDAALTPPATSAGPSGETRSGSQPALFGNRTPPMLDLNKTQPATDSPRP